MDQHDINWRFEYHPATTEADMDSHARIRALCGALASALNDVLPDGREKSLAMTNLEQTMFWANAAIARQRPVA